MTVCFQDKQSILFETWRLVSPLVFSPLVFLRTSISLKEIIITGLSPSLVLTSYTMQSLQSYWRQVNVFTWDHSRSVTNLAIPAPSFPFYCLLHSFLSRSFFSRMSPSLQLIRAMCAQFYDAIHASFISVFSIILVVIMTVCFEDKQSILFETWRLVSPLVFLRTSTSFKKRLLLHGCLPV